MPIVQKRTFNGREAPAMNAKTMPANDQQRCKYGGSILTLAMGGLFGFMMLDAYEPMTSGRVEYHLYLKSLPAIPQPVMIGLWWMCLAGAVLIIVLSLMPSVSVMIDDWKIVAQSIYTRKYKANYFRDILGVVVHKNYLTITDLHSNKIYLVKLFTPSGAFKSIENKIRTAAPDAL